MRSLGRILTGGILSVLILNSAGVAQNTRFASRFEQKIERTAKMSLSGLKVLTDGANGFLIDFTAQEDADVLGFNLYGLTRGGKEMRLNEMLIEGGVFDARSSQKDFSHEVKFLSTENRALTYFFVETVKTDGTRSRSEFVRAEYANNLKSLAENARRNIPSAKYRANETPIIEDSEKTEENSAPTTFSENKLISESPQVLRQRWIAAQPAAKIVVNKDGLYRVTQQELATAGFNVNTPNSFWQLYLNGEEQAITVGANNSYIEFYGRGLNTADNDSNIYYLVSGDQIGKRIGVRPRLYADFYEVPNFQTVLYRKDRRVYTNAILNGEAENWFGGIIYSQPLNIPLQVDGIDFSQPTINIEIGLQGFSSAEHTTQIKLNGTEIAVQRYTGRTTSIINLAVPTSLFLEGANTVTYTSLGTGDIALLDYFRLSYRKNYAATNNRLTASTPHRRRARIKGFTEPNVRVYEITDESNVKLIPSRVAAENGSYTVEVPADRPRKIFAVGESAIMSSPSITLNTASNWSNGQHNSQFLIVTPRRFRPAAEELAAFRRLEGMTVEVAEIEDLYDEFSFGLQSWTALRETVRVVRPEYMLFFADSTVDPRGFYTGAPAADIIPTKIFEGSFAEGVSDENMGDLNEDSLSESNLGRLPVKTLTEATNIVNKIKAFEQNPNRQSRGNLFISDAPDGYDFYGSNETLRAILPSGILTRHLNRLDAPHDVIKASILSELNSGYYFVTYSGHGTTSGWGNSPQLLTNPDAAAISNTNAKSSIFLILNCLNGAFAEISVDSLSETLMKNNNGGAVLSWASTTLTTPNEQELMFSEFYRQLSNGTSPLRTGEAVRQAKMYIPCYYSSSFSCDVRASWVTIGDPTTRLR